MVAPSFTIIERPEDDGGRLTLAAELGEETIGMVSAEVEAECMHLEALLVRPAHRGHGYAHAMLAELLSLGRTFGVRAVDVTYDGHRDHVDEVEAVLRRAGFEWPLPGMIACRGLVAEMLTAPWTRAKLPRDVTAFPWAELSEAESQRLGSIRGPGAWYPDSLGPFPDEAIEPLNSFGIRRAGEVIGWLLTSRAAPDDICYGRLFVRPDRRSGMTGVALLAHGIRVQAAAGIAYGSFGVRTTNEPMRRFLERQMSPFLESLVETRMAQRAL